MPVSSAGGQLRTDSRWAGSSVSNVQASSAPVSGVGGVAAGLALQERTSNVPANAGAAPASARVAATASSSRAAGRKGARHGTVL